MNKEKQLRVVEEHSFLPDENGRIMPIAHYCGQIQPSELERLTEKYGDCFQSDGDLRCLLSFSQAASRELLEKGCWLKKISKSASVYMSAL